MGMTWRGHFTLPFFLAEGGGIPSTEEKKGGMGERALMTHVPFSSVEEEGPRPPYPTLPTGAR